MKDEKGQVKSTHDDSAAAGVVAPAGGANHKRPADKKQAEKADKSVAQKAEVSPAGKVRKEDLDLLFKGANLSEDFQDDAFTLFEGAVSLKITEIKEELEAENVEKLSEAVEELEEKLSDYLDIFTEKYMEENELAIENGIKSEIAESLIDDLKTVLSEHNIDIPADKVDIVETLTERVSELETELNESLEATIADKKLLESHVKNKALEELSEDLDDVSKEKLAKLVEHVSFNNEEDFNKAALVLKESIVPTKTTKEDQLLEVTAVPLEENASGSLMSKYIKAANDMSSKS
ncbi:MAG: hypothetical protein COA52_00665 [Hyphomicrobiales bacterium]|nr:MAG: hypothetical protein COA52_00665 [Hyphomicrobiales bacterium]